MNQSGSRPHPIRAPGLRASARELMAARQAGLIDFIADALAVTKARANVAVVVTVFVGFALHADILGLWVVLLHTLAGTALLAASSAMANQAREFKFDQLMARTRHRPIAAGRLRPATARWISGALSVGGCLWLGAFVNWLAMLLAGLAFLDYVFLYTPLKRRGSICIPVGAISGALPLLVGWAATGAEFRFWAAVPFAVLFLWQIPHFLAIAWWRRTDYARAGYRILPRGDDRGSKTSRWSLLSAVAVFAVSVIPALANRVTGAYGIGTLLAGVLFSLAAARFAVKKSEASARTLFLASLYYLPLIFALMLLGRKGG